MKEEKILLIAQESKDIDQIILSIKQIMTNCVQDFDVNKLSLFDTEFLLVNIRAKAVNNEVTFNITDPDTDETIELTIDINEIEIQRNPNHSLLIDVTDTIKLKMKYPTIDVVKDITNSDDGNTDMLKIMTDCIDMVIEGENVYKLSDFSAEETREFVESLNSSALQNIKEFFDTMPIMRFEKKYTNKNGEEKTFVAAGTETFFI